MSNKSEKDIKQEIVALGCSDSRRKFGTETVSYLFLYKEASHNASIVSSCPWETETIQNLTIDVSC